MTELEMFEKSFQRPNNFFSLTESEKCDIDKRLGILNWDIRNLSNKQMERFIEHYKE